MPPVALKDITNKATTFDKPAVMREDADLETLRVGQKVFYRHPEQSWLEGVAEKISAQSVVVRDEDLGQNHTVSACDIYHCMKSNQSSGEGDLVSAANAHNLLSLNDLHESTLLHTVKLRYSQDIIYSNMGRIVLALNPFKFTIPEYRDSEMGQYIQEKEDLLPHAWQVAHNAFVDLRQSGDNQSILISGESGAGKTETTKTVIKYLGKLSCSQASATEEQMAESSKINQRLVEANPLLEAFGNAKTLRNNNSSRFGKFIKIAINHFGIITGASVTSYLLEKSRVCLQNVGERGYHIFYFFLAGCPDLEQYGLGDVETYKCLTSGECVNIEGLDDKECYAELLHSMDVLGFTEDERTDIFSILAAILHLQNVQFTAKCDDAAGVQDMDELEWAAKLLGIETDMLERVLTTVTSVVREETIVKTLNLEKCTTTRDTLSKALYNSLFNWLIQKVNNVLQGSHQGKMGDKFVGILDIFGFEQFKHNSFEQLCINYTNETLQNHYNAHVFAQELKEYEREGIDVATVEYQDNQPCIDLMEKKPHGVFSILDEECTFPKATDATFTQKLYSQVGQHPYFSTPRIQQPTFTINHYAGPVEYTTTEFLEKNKDSLGESLIQMVQSSNNSFISGLLQQYNPPTDTPKSKKPPTLISQFKSQMHSLKAVIDSTKPHWIRCVKPNTKQVPDLTEPKLILMQLNSSGVLSTIQMIRNGFPFRIPHRQWWRSFRLILPRHVLTSGNDNRRICEDLLQHFRDSDALPDPRHVQVGKTKVFMKQKAYEALQKLTRGAEAGAMKTIQAYVRRHLSLLELQRRVLMAVAAVRVQRAFRRYCKRRRVACAIKIQRQWRAGKMRSDERKARSKIAIEERVMRQQLVDSGMEMAVALADLYKAERDRRNAVAEGEYDARNAIRAEWDEHSREVRALIRRQQELEAEIAMNWKERYLREKEEWDFREELLVAERDDAAKLLREAREDRRELIQKNEELLRESEKLQDSKDEYKAKAKRYEKQLQAGPSPEMVEELQRMKELVADMEQKQLIDAKRALDLQNKEIRLQNQVEYLTQALEQKGLEVGRLEATTNEELGNKEEDLKSHLESENRMRKRIQTLENTEIRLQNEITYLKMALEREKEERGILERQRDRCSSVPAVAVEEPEDNTDDMSLFSTDNDSDDDIDLGSDLGTDDNVSLFGSPQFESKLLSAPFTSPGKQRKKSPMRKSPMRKSPMRKTPSKDRKEVDDFDHMDAFMAEMKPEDIADPEKWKRVSEELKRMVTNARNKNLRSPPYKAHV